MALLAVEMDPGRGQAETAVRTRAQSVVEETVRPHEVGRVS